VTDWGDNGHLQPPSVSFGPIAYGGAVSWCAATNRDLDVPAALDRFVLDDPTRTIGAVLQRMGTVWSGTGQRAVNASPLSAALLPTAMHLVSGVPDPEAVAAVLLDLERARAELDSATPRCSDGAVVVDELATAIRLARHGARRLLGVAPGAREELRDDLRGAIADQRRCWLRRSRPGGLAASVALLDATLQAYG